MKVRAASRTLRRVLMLLLAAPAAFAQDAPPPVPLIDVPFVSQTEALCGGAAAAMVLRYWGERRIEADSFAHLVDRSAAGIRTEALAAEIARLGWQTAAVAGSERLARAELAHGRPVLALIEDRPGTFHYIVVVAWTARGLVFHDPARAPFRVLPHDEFVQRWSAAGSWMLIVTPGDAAVEAPGASVATNRPSSGCEQLVATGVDAARANDLARAEQALAAALSCPGGAAPRELAGVRLLQRRWPDVTLLATAAVQADRGDTHAWKLLATSRFVQGDRAGALAAWNEAGEPRLDLIRIDGLDRTRHRVVEQLIGVDSGELLTAARFARAQRRLSALPAAASSRLDLVPVPAGLAELRAAVAERPVAPAGVLAFTGLGLIAAARREVGATFASIGGGGEILTASWRFWPGRPRGSLSLRVPAAWGGVWGIEAEAERQPIDAAATDTSSRRAAMVAAESWATSMLKWAITAGAENRKGLGTFGLVGAGLTLASRRDRLELQVDARRWLGRRGFTVGGATLTGRSGSERRGRIFVGSATMRAASAATPLDLWAAGDTGDVRPTLLRAHPLLTRGRLRSGRLGRLLLQGSAEAQQWWGSDRLLRPGAAVFVDAAHTARRAGLSSKGDIDVGVGFRIGAAGIPGVFNIDIARGLSDGDAAVSLTYRP